MIILTVLKDAGEREIHLLVMRSIKHEIYLGREFPQYKYVRGHRSFVSQ